MSTKKMSEISLQSLPPMRMACYQAVSLEPENDGAQFMDAWVQARGLQGVRRFGFDSPVSEEQAKAGLRGYEQWYSVPEGIPGADGVMIRQFPGGRYAMLRLFNPFEAPFETIPAGWQHLHEWAQAQTDVKGGCHQCLEELVPGQAGALDLVLYYPIE
jgi:AraC family transcriptional regulator